MAVRGRGAGRGIVKRDMRAWRGNRRSLGHHNSPPMRRVPRKAGSRAKP